MCSPRNAVGQRFACASRSFRVGGLHPDMKEAGWESVRELAYGDRGG